MLLSFVILFNFFKVTSSFILFFNSLLILSSHWMITHTHTVLMHQQQNLAAELQLTISSPTTIDAQPPVMTMEVIYAPILPRSIYSLPNLGFILL